MKHLILLFLFVFSSFQVEAQVMIENVSKGYEGLIYVEGYGYVTNYMIKGRRQIGFYGYDLSEIGVFELCATIDRSCSEPIEEGYYNGELLLLRTRKLKYSYGPRNYLGITNSGEIINMPFTKVGLAGGYVYPVMNKGFYLFDQKTLCFFNNKLELVWEKKYDPEGKFEFSAYVPPILIQDNIFFGLHDNTYTKNKIRPAIQGYAYSGEKIFDYSLNKEEVDVCFITEINGLVALGLLNGKTVFPTKRTVEIGAEKLILKSIDLDGKLVKENEINLHVNHLFTFRQHVRNFTVVESYPQSNYTDLIFYSTNKEDDTGDPVNHHQVLRMDKDLNLEFYPSREILKEADFKKYHPFYIVPGVTDGELPFIVCFNKEDETIDLLSFDGEKSNKTVSTGSDEEREENTKEENEEENTSIEVSHFQVLPNNNGNYVISFLDVAQKRVIITFY